MRPTIPFKFNGVWSWWQFSVWFWTINGIPFCSESKGKLSLDDHIPFNLKERNFFSIFLREEWKNVSKMKQNLVLVNETKFILKKTFSRLFGTERNSIWFKFVFILQIRIVYSVSIVSKFTESDEIWQFLHRKRVNVYFYIHQNLTH